MADALGDNWWENDVQEKSKKLKTGGKKKKAKQTQKDTYTILSSGNLKKNNLKRKPEDAGTQQNESKKKAKLSEQENTAPQKDVKQGPKVPNEKKKQKFTKQKKKGKQKPKDSPGQSKSTEAAEPKDKSLAEKKKKKDKKRISELPDEELSKPGTAEDLRSLMTKQLKDRLGEAALEDILPDPAADFFSCNLESLEPGDYLKSILPGWRANVKKSLFMKKMGSPSLLIITSSAIRAVGLNRDIKDFVTDKGKVVKLFAKHMKLEEQKKFLAKTNCQVGIGTPARISQLIKQGALQLEDLVGVVFDWNWRDQKLKRMADIPEVRGDLVTLIKDFLYETVQGSACKFGLL